MSLEDQLKNPEYRNWVRATLGLKVLKDGLAPFVEEQAKHLHNYFNPNNVQCGLCNRKTLLPKHGYTNTTCPHGLKCTCNGRNKRPCPHTTRICSEMYDLIVDDYNGYIPNKSTTEIKQLSWSNTDTTKWTHDPWEVAKCYIHTSGYNDKHSAVECDASGLLTICINCKTIRSKITPANFEHTRERRNEILHTSTFEVKDTELASTIDLMLDVLKEQDIMVFASAKNAIVDLEELKNDTKAIGRVESLEARMLAVEALTKKMKDLENTIANVAEDKDEPADVLQKLKTELAEVSRVRDTQQALITEIRDLQDNQQQLIKRIEELEKETQPKKCIGLTGRIAYTVFDYDKGLQRYLMETYKERYLDVDVSPLLPEVEHIDEMFIPLVISRKLKGRLNRTEEIRNFNDLFFNDKDRVRILFLAADAGMGKTTLCKKIISTWVKAFDKGFRKTKRQHNSEDHEFTADEEQWRKTEKENIKFMKKFKYLFFVYLRHAHSHLSVEDMVEHQLLRDKYPGIFRHIIQSDPTSCLFILDGLDEWKPTREQQETPMHSGTRGLPFENHFCTILYTTRPWKLTEIVEQNHGHKWEIELNGLTDRSSKWLVYKMLRKLSDTPLQYTDFFTELRTKQILHFQTIPIMVKLLLCLWFDNHELSDKITMIYCDVLNLVLKHFSRMKGGIQATKRTCSTCLPDVLAISECAKYNDLLLALCRFSHSTYAKEDSLVFTADQLELYGMSCDDIKICLASGLLSKTAIDKTTLDQHVQISYIHKTFQEFFVALHIAGTPGQLSALLTTCNTRAHLAEQFVVLKLVCGLDNSAAKKIAEHIYTDQIRDVDETVVNEHTMHVAQLEYENSIQDTLLSYIRESKEPDERSVPIKAVHIQRSNKGDLEMVAKYFDPSTMKTLRLDNVSLPELGYWNHMCGLVHLGMENYGFSEQVTPTALCTVMENCSRTLTKLTIHNEVHIHLTHSKATSLLCLPMLTDISVNGVECKSDSECGCDSQGIEHDSSTKHSRTTHVKHCRLTHTSQMLFHVLDAPKLETFHLSCSDCEEPLNGLHRLMQTCKIIQYMHIESSYIDDTILQLSHQIRSLRLVTLREVTIRSAALKSLILSVPADHPVVLIRLLNVNIVNDEEATWLLKTWGVNSGNKRSKNIVVNIMNKSACNKPSVFTLSMGMKVELYWMWDEAEHWVMGCDIYSEENPNGTNEQLLTMMQYLDDGKTFWYVMDVDGRQVQKGTDEKAMWSYIDKVRSDLNAGKVKAEITGKNCFDLTCQFRPELES